MDHLISGGVLVSIDLKTLKRELMKKIKEIHYGS
jgi:hypothetical protein